MKRQAVIAALALLMFSGLCIMEKSMVAARPETKDECTSSVYLLAGEFRTVAANLLWIKADAYHEEYERRHTNWTKDKDLQGMIQLIVKLDPTFVEAYSVGASLYGNTPEGNKKAFEWLKRGLKHNPRSWQLHRDMAIICIREFDSPRPALHHALLAKSYCEDSFYQAALQRLVITIEKEITDREEQKQSEKPKDPDG